MFTSLHRHRLCLGIVLGVGLTHAMYAPPAIAQISSAAVNGTVHDQTGAAVPSAAVILQNTATSVSRSTTTNDGGNYAFPSVAPGQYTVRISAPSFQTEQISAFTVAVDQVVSMNSTLRPGDVNTSIEVEAQGAQIQSSTSQLGTVIDQKKVQDLPLNGRNFTQLLTLTPGATPVSVGQNSGGGNTPVIAGSSYTMPSINGQPNRSTLYLVDGLNDNNAFFNTYAVPPNVDAIQEFKINSHNDAQYGQVTGGVVNVATKSGTNAYHGAVWDFLRNNAFDARPRFSSVYSYHVNQFGGVFGGPLSIPKIYNGRDKTFFFVSYEGSRYSRSNASYFLQPTAAQLGESTWGGPQDLGFGDFSTGTTGVAGCGDKSATSQQRCQLYDPTVANTASSRPAFVGNQIPVSKMDARSVALIHKIFSAPVTVPGFASTQYNGIITTPTRQTSHNYSARLDQHIGDKDFIFFRYSGIKLNGTAPGSVPHLQVITSNPAEQYGASWMHIFGPRMSLQVQYGRTHVGFAAPNLFDISNADLLRTYGVDPSFSSYVGGISLFPTLSITGYFSGAGESSNPAKNQSSIHEYKGQVINVLGRHQITWGGGWDQANYEQYVRTSSITFNGASTGNFSGNPGSTVATGQTTQSGNGMASFLLNYPSNFNFRNVLVTERPGGIASAFIQDSWKATPNLTINIGVRYDRSVTPHFGTDATIGQQGSIETGDFDFTTGKYIIQVAPPLCSVRGHAPCLPSASLPANVEISPNRKIMKGTKTNVGPRFGLAYSINPKLAFRAGFGINFDNWSAIIQLPQNFQGSWPDVGTRALDNTNTPGTAYTSSQNPFGSNSGSQPAATPFDATNVNYFVDPNINNPYSEQWNIGIEQQLGNNTIMSVNYVGSQSHRTDIGGYTNIGQPGPGVSFAARRAAGTAGQPFPYTVPNRWDTSNGNASYNSLQASLLRQFHNGFGFTAAYTWSKSIDSGQSGWFGVEGSGLQNRYDLRGSRSVSAYDIPQLLAIGINQELPFGKGRRYYTGNRFTDFVLGGWQVNLIFTARSGQPFSINAAGDIANVGNGSTYMRANLVGDPSIDNPSASKWFNTSAFAIPSSGTYGNSSRNMLRTSQVWNLDTSVFRNFHIYKETNLTFRAESFNVANHPSLGTPGSTITTPSTFGIVSSTTGNQRLMQFAAKINF